MEKITLSKPIPYGDTLLSEITLREPTAGDLRGIDLASINRVDVDTTLKLVARLSVTHVVEAQLSALHPYDLGRLSGAVVGFFAEPEAPSPTTP